MELKYGYARAVCLSAVFLRITPTSLPERLAGVQLFFDWSLLVV